jgi:hypothetical protein
MRAAPRLPGLIGGDGQPWAISRQSAAQRIKSLFDHLVGAGEERRQYCQVKRVFRVFDCRAANRPRGLG